MVDDNLDLDYEYASDHDDEQEEAKPEEQIDTEAADLLATPEAGTPQAEVKTPAEIVKGPVVTISFEVSLTENEAQSSYPKSDPNWVVESRVLKYCTKCEKKYHNLEGCRVEHPELEAADRAKRADRDAKRARGERHRGVTRSRGGRRGGSRGRGGYDGYGSGGEYRRGRDGGYGSGGDTWYGGSGYNSGSAGYNSGRDSYRDERRRGPKRVKRDRDGPWKEGNELSY